MGHSLPQSPTGPFNWHGLLILSHSDLFLQSLFRGSSIHKGISVYFPIHLTLCLEFRAKAYMVQWRGYFIYFSFYYLLEYLKYSSENGKEY